MLALDGTDAAAPSHHAWLHDGYGPIQGEPPSFVAKGIVHSSCKAVRSGGVSSKVPSLNGTIWKVPSSVPARRLETLSWWYTPNANARKQLLHTVQGQLRSVVLIFDNTWGPVTAMGSASLRNSIYTLTRFRIHKSVHRTESWSRSGEDFGPSESILCFGMSNSEFLGITTEA